jgi:hypothetical protein
MTAPIVTSIPPVFSRKDAAGQEIGDAYLGRCIASWRACGFEPVTVNAEAEELHPLIAALDVQVVRVPRDARALTGRPHVYLADLLDAARRLSAERVFIVNADIELEMSDTARDRLARLGPMETVGVRRRDHGGEKSLATPPYECGIDLLGAGREALDGIDAGTLVFGMPWWDHYLPLRLLWRGAQVVPCPEVRAWHLDHDGRWNKQQYVSSGREFLQLVEGTPAPMRRDPWVDAHVAGLARIRRGHYGASPPRRIEARLLAALMPRSYTQARRVLRETSLSNIALLDRLAGGA